MCRPSAHTSPFKPACGLRLALAPLPADALGWGVCGSALAEFRAALSPIRQGTRTCSSHQL
eukprot:620972-Amphidinium_carterae.1